MTNLFLLRQALQFMGYDIKMIEFIIQRTTAVEKEEFIQDAIATGFDVKRYMEGVRTDDGYVIDRETLDAVTSLIARRGVKLSKGGNHEQ